MRVATMVILIGIILACPLLCGLAEACHDAHQEHASGKADAPAPAHCPEESDDCVCRGAVQSPDVRVPDLTFAIESHWLDEFSFGPARPLPHPHANLTPDGSPTGLAGWGSSSTVRALLQNFRC
ncbi:hypothetical protein EP7_000912 [Isosphaeraceae bacterium EP7]